MNSVVMLFLRETWQRLVTKSPKYHNYLSVVATICAVIIGLPEFLDMFHIVVPQVLDPYISKMIVVASLVAAFVAQLSVQNPDDIKTKN